MLAAAGAACPAAVRAEEVHVTADTDFRFYEVRSPATSVAWSRRRLVQTLGVGWARALPRDGDRDRPIRIATSLRLRLDQDFGRTCFVESDGCVQATDVKDEGEYQPLARDGAIDVPAAWVEARGLPGGLSVRAGRQLRASSIGFLRVDGAGIRVEPWGFAAAEAYGGLVVRSTSLAGSDAFVPQGLLRVDLPDDVEPSRVPFVSPPARTWVVGAWLEGGRSEWVRARLGFRELRDESGLVARRVALELSSQPLPTWRLHAQGVWDPLDGTLVDGAVGTEVLLDQVTLHAGVERHVPRFDLGSIWAWFDVVPVDRARFGATYHPHRRLEVGGTLLGRRADGPDGAPELDAGFEAHGAVTRGPWRTELAGGLEDGDLSALAHVRLRVVRHLGPLARLSLRGSVWHFDDPLRQGMYGTILSEALAAEVRITRETAVRAELEHAYSRVTGHRIRGMVGLHVEVWR